MPIRLLADGRSETHQMQLEDSVGLQAAVGIAAIFRLAEGKRERGERLDLWRRRMILLGSVHRILSIALPSVGAMRRRARSLLAGSSSRSSRVVKVPQMIRILSITKSAIRTSGRDM